MSDKPTFRTFPCLRPFGWLYGFVTSLRNRLYDRGIFSSYTAGTPVISIGNITAGGTGKTPHTEYLVNLLRERYRVAVLSRGYGRRTRGYIQITETSTAAEVGDEPLQMSRKFSDVTFAVCEKRAEGIQRLCGTAAPDVIILDDAFQHRAVTPSLNILLINWNRDILKDRMIPEGLLRESADGRGRADIIVVTKYPEEGGTQNAAYRNELALSDNQELYFSRYEYPDLLPYEPDGKPRALESVGSGTSVLLATGIASPGLIKEELERHKASVSSLRFADHHNFSINDIRSIEAAAARLTGSDRIAVITEKDAARLQNAAISPELRKILYILPVKVRILGDSAAFDKRITEHIEEFRKGI